MSTLFGSKSPRVFVSHSHIDIEWCNRFVEALQRANLDVWYDKQGLYIGAQWVHSIEEELQGREIFLIVLTPDAWNSDWVQSELALALGQRKRIIGVIHRPTQITGFVTTYQLLDCVGEDANAAAIRVATALGGLSPTASLRSHHQISPPTSRSTQSADLAGLVEQCSRRLIGLGFETRISNGTRVIIPPMYDVPAGEFLMGSDPSRDKDASPEEQPQHYVTLAAFQIARFPVTASEYACFMRSIRNEVPTHPRHLTEGEEAIGWGDHPVVFVTWHEANSYAAWLTKTTGQQWRLPTEAEWEKAARGSDGRIYPWGNAFDISRCQTRENGNNGTCPVGTYPEGASPCGAQDMAGEVWEYTSTCYKKYPYLAGDGRESTDLTDERSIRGGCFFSPNGGARAACRGHTTLDFQGAGIGFRLVRTMSDL